jgi:cytochrome c oxidase cbb3-type subunit III
VINHTENKDYNKELTMLSKYSKPLKKPVQQLFLLPGLLLFSLTASAQASGTKTASSLSEPAIIMAIIVIAGLALVIFILGNSVVAARSVYEERMRREKEQNTSSSIKSILLIIVAAFSATQSAMAQVSEDVKENTASATIGGLPATTFYLITGVIALEFFVILALLNTLKFFTGVKSKPLFDVERLFAPPSGSSLTTWWNKINKSVAIEREKDIDLSHDYDGIRELDNAVPPWWRWTFIATILFGVIYLWRFHISETAPLQLEELKIAMRQADAERDAYLKTAASKVDENTVKLLDESGIATGKALFSTNCVACHGSNGEGNAVGPNLTDEYWLNKGGISDIFKTIKYGRVEKGMKSWKDDFTPTQIAQLASFVKSIGGSKPANAKAPQGELYTEQAAAVGDSANAQPTIAGDSINLKTK